MDNTVTQWFYVCAPARTGVYQTRSREFKGYLDFQYWDGVRWHRCMGTADDAYARRTDETFFQHPEWRGLATKPNAGGSDE